MEEFKELILKCKKLCCIELIKIKKDISVEATMQQIETVIIPEMDKLIELIDRNMLPPQNERYLDSFANAFTVWGWNMQNPSELFIILTELNNKYKRL